MLLSLLALGILASFNVPAASACTCVMPPSPQEALGEATAVFSGTVVNIDAPMGLSISSADPVKYTFSVSNVWKGPQSQEIIVASERNGASCGYEFKEDEEYLVYSFGEKDNLRTNICTRTKEMIFANPDLLALDGGEEINEETGGEEEEKEVVEEEPAEPKPVSPPGIFRSIWLWILSLFR